MKEIADESVHDLGDESVDDEIKEENFAEAEVDWMTLEQVRDALERVKNGTFGLCVMCGEKIEEKRLEATPWTPYCLKHAKELGTPEKGRAATL